MRQLQEWNRVPSSHIAIPTTTNWTMILATIIPNIVFVERKTLFCYYTVLKLVPCRGFLYRSHAWLITLLLLANYFIDHVFYIWISNYLPLLIFGAEGLEIDPWSNPVKFMILLTNIVIWVCVFNWSLTSIK